MCLINLAYAYSVNGIGIRIWDKNLGGTDRQTDRHTDTTVYRVALKLKRYICIDK